MKTLICQTVTAPTTAELRRLRDEVRDADLVELRLDSVSDPDVVAALADRRLPVVVTCRPVWEGGAFRGSEEERLRLLGDALKLGAEYVDVEFRAAYAALLNGTDRERVVLSMHDFERLPEDLSGTAVAMCRTGAGVVKIAARVNRLSDCVRLLDVANAMPAPPGRIIIGMGEAGIATRVLASRFGSAWTYAGALSGIGQVGLQSLLGGYRFRSIQSATELYGVTGLPVSHSVSPAMHNAAFAATGRNAVYLPLPASDADDFLAFATAFNLKGASVTIPHKVALFEKLEALGGADALSRQAGAINTVRAANGGWEGTNTDVDGFLRPLVDRGVTLRRARVSILGAGGAARAAALGLAREGALVRVHGRQPERAAEVARLVSGEIGPWPPEAGSWDVLVNSTPIGMHPKPEASPITAELLTGHVVYDLVYNPADTRLLRDARQHGRRTIGGLEMLVAQAEAQFKYWTGAAPPSGVMKRAAESRLSEFAS